MLFDLDFVITSWVVEWVKVCLLQKLVLRITKGNGHPDTSYLRLTILNVETNYGTIFDNVLRKIFRSYLHIIIQNFCTRGFHPMHFQFLQLQEMHNRVLSNHMAANVWTNLSWCVIVYVMAWYRQSTSYYRHAYSPILWRTTLNITTRESMRLSVCVYTDPDSKVHGPTWGPPGSCRPQIRGLWTDQPVDGDICH